jgi:hypothetical protein
MGKGLDSMGQAAVSADQQAPFEVGFPTAGAHEAEKYADTLQVADVPSHG